MGANPMAISTPHLAILNLTRCLNLALGKADVKALHALDVIEVKRARIVKPAIHAPGLCFVCAEPSAKFLGASARGLPIALSPLDFGVGVVGATIFWIVWAIARPAVCLAHLVGVAVPPLPRRLPSAGSFFLNIHKRIITRNNYPCKPAIFEATYEPAP